MSWATLFEDFRGQVSWGRICSFVALIVAVMGQFNHASIDSLKIWLQVAVGGYGASKATEAISYIGKAFGAKSNDESTGDTK